MGFFHIKPLWFYHLECRSCSHFDTWYRWKEKWCRCCKITLSWYTKVFTRYQGVIKKIQTELENVFTEIETSLKSS